MNKEKIIIFGASNLGKIAFNILKDRYKICYFSDNDKSKWNKFFCDTKTISPEELIDFKDIKLIIASMYYDEISVQLKRMGIGNIYIFSYADSNDKTYSKKYFIDKMCNLDTYTNLRLDEDFKSKFIDDFSLIYGNGSPSKKNDVKKISSEKKNVLVIAYFFPPIGGSAIQRTLKYVKYLKEYGWNPIVLTVGEEYCIYEKDFSLMDEVPNDINVLRINHTYINSEQFNYEMAQQIINLIYGIVNDQCIMEEYLAKIKKNQCSKRQNILEPDRYISWVNSALKDIEKIIDLGNIDLIYTTSNPYSNNFIGYYIKKKYNIPWVADFRDEWTNHHYAEFNYKGDKFRWKLHRHLEQNIVDFADKVITVTPISSENYRNIFNLPHDKVVTITNGYDEGDFKHIVNNENINDKFNILFYGSLYLNNSYIDNVIISINKLIEEGLIDKELIEINLIGKINLDILDIFKEVDIYKLVRHEKYKPHLECLSIASQSDLLLLPIGKEDALLPVYTGKVFEYIRLAIPILAISPKGSVVEELLKDTKCGKNFEYDDLSSIENYILKQYMDWILGGYQFNVNKSKIQEYDRRRLTGKLSEIFKDLILKIK